MSQRVPLLVAAIALVGLVGVPAAYAGLGQYQTAVSGEPSLISYYTFEGDAGGSVTDVTANTFDGTLQGAATYGLGVGDTGQCYSSNGDGWVNMGAVADFEFTDGTGTVEAWVRPTWTSAGDQVVAASRNGGPTRYSIHVGGSRTYTNSYTGPAWSHADASFTQNRWHHLVYVFDASQLRIYVDGLPYSVIYDWQGDRHDLGTGAGMPFQIGSSSPGGAEVWIGDIDEVALYSDTLTDAAVLAHYTAFYTPAPGMSLTPVTDALRIPDNAGPKNYTLTLPAPAGAGGTQITLAYSDAVLEVADAGDVVIPTGGSITVPAGSSSAGLKVRAVGPGTTALAATAAGVYQAVSSIAVDRATITLSPNSKTFVSPGDLGPLDVTIDLDGVVAGPGGIPVTLTYATGVIQVTNAGGTAIPSGSTVTVPEGSSQVVVKLTGVGPGATPLTASSFGFTTGQGNYGAEFPKSPELIAYQSLVKSEGSLIGYYTFDDDMGSVLDQKPTGAPINGTLVGTTTFTARQEGGRVLQVGGLGHVNFGAVTDFAFPDGTGTIELWVRPGAPPNGFGSNPCFLASRNGPSRYSLHMNNSRVNWGIWQNSSYTTQAISLVEDKWYHIVAVVNAGQITLYTDGTIIGINAQTLGPEGQTFQIASSSPGGGERWIGSIDEVAIYSEPLTSAQVINHYKTLIPDMPTAASPVVAAYEAAVMAEPSLVSFYNFEGDSFDPNGVTDKRGSNHGSALGDLSFGRGFAGGQALHGFGAGYVSLGNVDAFKFSNDESGTVEAWVTTSAIGAGNRSLFAGRDATLNRYTLHVNTSSNGMQVTTPSGSSLAAAPGGLTRGTWYHVAAVFENGLLSYYINGEPVLSNVARALGDPATTSFQIAAGTNIPSFLYAGKIDELAVYSDPLTPAQIAAHFNTAALTLSPGGYEFVLPSDPGPVAVTLALPAGSVAPAGGKAVTLTFDAAIVQVDAGGGPLASGDSVVVPEGQNSLNLAVSALDLGTTFLTASAEGVMFGDSAFFRVLLADQGIIIINDHFDDNPANNAALDLTALEINDNGPGSGWHLNYNKPQRERGTSWQSLEGGAGWNSSGINSKVEDNFRVMTEDGSRIEWVINSVTVSADNTVEQGQFPGGELADVRHEFGVVSSNRINAGSNELFNNTAGGLYVNVFYWANGTMPTQDILVTGDVRFVNANHPAGDLESLAGLETVATFSLPNVSRITPDSPLVITIEVNQAGWKIGASPESGATFTPLEPGLTIEQGKLVGGWDVNSLNDAAITSEFDNGASLWALFQNMNTGRGSANVDRVKVCVGCTLTTDCPDPFSDADRDGDTDQADFALLQLCYNGPGGGTPEGCRCFDRNEDGDISSEDVAAFINCAAQTGPMLPSDPTCDD